MMLIAVVEVHNIRQHVVSIDMTPIIHVIFDLEEYTNVLCASASRHSLSLDEWVGWHKFVHAFNFS